jgi:hypothetical protein
MSNNSSLVSNLTWGALTSLFPIVTIGYKYIKNPELTEKIFPFEYLTHLPFLTAFVHTVLTMVVTPIIKTTDLAPYSNWVIGALAGIVYATYITKIPDRDITKLVWGMRKQRNIYFYMIFYWIAIYGIVLPYLQRHVCFYGPKGF